MLYSEPAPPGAPAPRLDIPQGVIEALKTGNKIEAILLYRAARKLGLREAKEAVEQIEREQR